MMEKLPLRDVRVVDLTMGWAGPLATRHLADMGAEVIKIEACSHPDWWRGWEHSPEALASREHEKNPSFNMINRNKLGVAIELTEPALCGPGYYHMHSVTPVSFGARHELVRFRTTR